MVKAGAAFPAFFRHPVKQERPSGYSEKPDEHWMIAVNTN